MMKKLPLLLLILIFVFAAISCDKKKEKYPDRTEKVSEYATINSLKSVFLALDKYQINDVSKATSNATYPGKADPASSAFIWGMLSSDAMFAHKAKDSPKLVSTAALMKKIAPALALTEEANEYNLRVGTLARQGNWKDIEILTSGLQSTVDMKLMDAKRYDIYTLSCLGAWTHTTNRLARLFGQNYDAVKTGILQQVETWNNLANNLELLKAEQNADSKVLAATPLVKELQGIIANADKNTYSLEQVQQMTGITDHIESVFLK